MQTAQGKWTDTDLNSKWSSTTVNSTQTITHTFTIITNLYRDDKEYYESGLYKKLLKEEQIQKMKDSWMIKNTRINKKFLDVKKCINIRNQLPPKFRLDETRTN